MEYVHFKSALWGGGWVHGEKLVVCSFLWEVLEEEGVWECVAVRWAGWLVLDREREIIGLGVLL